MALPCMLQAEYLIVRLKNGQNEPFTTCVFFFCITLDPPTKYAFTYVSKGEKSGIII